MKQFTQTGMGASASEVQAEWDKFQVGLKTMLLDTVEGSPFQAKAVWANDSWMLTVTGRTGETFQGIYKFGNEELAVTGAVRGKVVTWQAADVRHIRGNFGADAHTGTILTDKAGDRIVFNWQNAQGRAGSFEVRRK